MLGMDNPFDETFILNIMRHHGLEPSERDLLLFKAGRLFEHGILAPDFSDEQGMNIVGCVGLLVHIAEEVPHGALPKN